MNMYEIKKKMHMMSVMHIMDTFSIHYMCFYYYCLYYIFIFFLFILILLL